MLTRRVMASQVGCGNLQVQRLSSAHAPCANAIAKAEQEVRVLRASCQQLTQDRAQAVGNIRKAEGEVSSPLICFWLFLSSWR